MNLLYTLTTYPPSTGGAQIHQHQLACHLRERHGVRVVSHWDRNRTDWLLGTTLRAPSGARNYTIDGIDVHCLGITPVDKIAMAPFVFGYYPFMAAALPSVGPIASRIEKRMRKFSDTVDLIHNVRIGREGLSYASYNAARRRDIPFVLTPVHHPRWVGWRYRDYNRLYRLSDAVLTLTEAEKRVLIGLGVDEKRLHVIGHGPVLSGEGNPDEFRKTHGIDGPMVLFLGQHYGYKGYRQLLEATHRVWEKEPRVHFVFIGPPVGQSEDVFREKADPRIHRLGIVDLEEKTSALAASTLLCVPSTQESFGGVYVEAWSFGKPVIGCDIPAVSEVITHGEDGYLVEQESVALSGRILDLLTDPVLARKMGETGKRKVEAKYTWPRIADRVEKIYQELISG